MNWTILIQDLIASGLSEASIAQRVGGITQASIHRIKKGEISEPRYGLGTRLIALHKSLVTE